MEATFTAFVGESLLTTDTLSEILLKAKAYLDSDGEETVLIFEDKTGRQIDFDFRGSPREVLERLKIHPLFSVKPVEERPQAGPGRPRLGVTCREVCLLPRHWEWLESQTGGSSTTLRRLVEEARKREPETAILAEKRDAAAKFMMVMAGNRENFEEVTRALYAGNYEKASALMEVWPEDIRAHAARLLRNCVEAEQKGDRP